jgi:hypothetical protein
MMPVKAITYLAIAIAITNSVAFAKSTVSQSTQGITKVDPAEAQKGYLDAAGQSAKNYSKDFLHRLDFTVVGTGCAICLMGIQTKLKSKAGVVKAAVMLKPPYGASVVYDSKQITKDAIVDIANHQKKNVHVDSINDAAITKIPIVLIPPHFKEGQ